MRPSSAGRANREVIERLFLPISLFERSKISEKESLLRQVLFEIPLKAPWNLGPLGQVPGFGFGLVLLIWLVWGGISLWRDSKRADFVAAEWRSSALFVLGGAVVIVLAPRLAPISHIPVFGYGAMLVVGAMLSGWTASVRSRLVGAPPNLAWDMTIALILAGVVGSRLFFLIQKHELAFANCRTLVDFLKTIVNLPDGGLVLYGGLILGAIVYVYLCKKHGLHPLKFGDAVVPAVFIGEACGRIGCFLNGCCFGDACSLPWGVSFPRDSVPWAALEQRGFVLEVSAATYPLHPTQLYSTLNALVLAAITTVYYRYRLGHGSVLALGIMSYALSRSCLEVLRGDEFGQFGTVLTISQWVSVFVFLGGAVLAWWSWTHARAQLTSLPTSAPDSSGTV